MKRPHSFRDWLMESGSQGLRPIIDRVLRLVELGLIENPKNSWGLVEAVLRELYPNFRVAAGHGDQYIDKTITLTREDGRFVLLFRHGFRDYEWYSGEPGTPPSSAKFIANWELTSSRNLAAFGERRAIEAALLILDAVVPVIDKNLVTAGESLSEAAQPARAGAEPGHRDPAAELDRIIRLWELGLAGSDKKFTSWSLALLALEQTYPELQFFEDHLLGAIRRAIGIKGPGDRWLNLIRHGFGSYDWIRGVGITARGEKTTWTMPDKIVRETPPGSLTRVVGAATAILREVGPLIDEWLLTANEAFHPTHLSGEPHGREWVVEATPEFLANWHVRHSVRARCEIGLPTPFAEVEIGGKTGYLTLTLRAKSLSGEPLLHWTLGVEGSGAEVETGYWPLAETGELDSTGSFKITWAPR